MIIQPIYDYIGDFREGLAVISIEGRSGFINTKGDVVIPLSFNGASDFHEGMAVVEVDGKWGFIDTSGKVVIQPSYNCALDFSEGLAPVQLSDGKWEFINKKGNIVVQPKYERAASFSEGLAFIELNGKKGFIDTKGRMVLTIPASYEKLDYTISYFFNNSLLAVYSNPFPTVSVLVGYIDKNGTQYWEDPAIWPMSGYNAQHTGQCPYDRSKNNGTLKWKFQTDAQINSSPVIANDGTIYIGPSADNYLYALNPDGTLKWKYQTYDVYSSPAIDSYQLYLDSPGPEKCS